MATISITSCANQQAKLDEAAARQGEAQGQLKAELPPMPADCSAEEPHAALYVGLEPTIVIKAERRATARANARIRRCNGAGGFYDTLREEWVP